MSVAPVLNIFKINYYALSQNLTAISNEESLHLISQKCSSINWIVGHLLVIRDDIHILMGLPPMCGDELKQLYSAGTFPSTSMTSLRELKRMLEESQSRITGLLSRMIQEGEYEEALMVELSGYGFHEAYHIGQIGLLRKLIGKSTVLG